MLVSTRGRYALRFMIDLAQQEGGAAVTLKAVSGRQDISVKYLEQIVSSLCRAGLIRSVRGNQGGYMLTRAPGEYTAGEILRTVEGSLAPVSCLANPENECPRRAFCKSVAFWEGMMRVVEQYADSVTLADLTGDGPPL